MSEKLVARKLNQEEQLAWNLAALEAVSATKGAFRDAVALMRPFYDPSCQTAYTDKYCRVGVGEWFFNLNKYQMMAGILHECLHVLNQHFLRGEAISVTPDVWNIAGDFEINCSLCLVEGIDISMGVHPAKGPYKYPINKTMEYYVSEITNDPDYDKDDNLGNGDDSDCSYDEDEDSDGDEGDSGAGDAPGDGEPGGEGEGDSDGDGDGDGEGQGSGSGSGQGKPGNGKGQGKPGKDGKDNGKSGGDKECTNPAHDHSGKGGKPAVCDRATDKRSEAADEAGITKASNAEQSIAKQNTLSRIQEVIAEESSKNRGSGHLDEFLKITLDRMKPAKVNWRSILRKVVAHSAANAVKGKTDYSYARPNRRHTNSKYILPGFVQYQPTIAFGIDTSGSMGRGDYQRLLSEIEGIVKETSRSRNGLSVFNIDTQVSKIQAVRAVKDVDLRGGGGTDMSVAWRFLKSRGRKQAPDIFILSTDGYTDWNSVIESLTEVQKWFSSVILVTTKGGYESVPEDLKKIAKVIDISDEKD